MDEYIPIGQQLFVLLKDVLKLPDKTTAFSLQVAVNDVVRVSSTHIVTLAIEGEILTISTKTAYELAQTTMRGEEDSESLLIGRHEA